MELILSLSAIALLGTVLAALLKPSAPAVAVAVSLVSSLVLLYRVFDLLGQTFASLSNFMAAAGLDGELYFPVIKAVGIAVVVRVVSGLCRDAGQSALGSKLEFSGAAASIAVCIPLIEQVFELMGSILSS